MRKTVVKSVEVQSLRRLFALGICSFVWLQSSIADAADRINAGAPEVPTVSGEDTPSCPEATYLLCDTTGNCACEPIKPPECPTGQTLECDATASNCDCVDIEPPDACPGTARRHTLLWKCSQGFPICVENPNGKRNITIDGGTALGDDWDYPGAAAVFTLKLSAVAKVAKSCFVCGCFRLDGCFVPETKVQMADGSMRAIQDVAAGEYLWNPMTEAPARVKQIIQGPEGNPLVRFGYGESLLTVTGEHPVLTEDGLIKAKELTLDSRVIDASGAARGLETLEAVLPTEGQQVINVVLEGDHDDLDKHYLLADGITTGDLILQHTLSAVK